MSTRDHLPGADSIDLTPPRADGPVLLEVPATTGSLRLARLTASAVAAGAGFDLDAVEDLRVVVDEVSAVLVGAATPGARLRLTFSPDGDSVRVEARCVAPGASPHPIAAELLDMLADEVVVADEGSDRVFRVLVSPSDDGG